MSERKILLVLHPHRPEAKTVAQEIVSTLHNEGFSFLVTSETAVDGVFFVDKKELSKHSSSIELALVLGGDGTILRGAEQIHGTKIGRAHV